MFCNKCGNEVANGSAFCQKCGGKIIDELISVDNHMSNTIANQQQRQGVINKPVNLSLAGLVLAILAFLIGWILPDFGVSAALSWILWIAAIVLSSLGLSRGNKGFAIAGLTVAAVDIFIFLVIAL
jgi:hypothetical protein